jgi:hypothetical protein
MSLDEEFDVAKKKSLAKNFYFIDSIEEVFGAVSTSPSSLCASFNFALPFSITRAFSQHLMA